MSGEKVDITFHGAAYIAGVIRDESTRSGIMAAFEGASAAALLAQQDPAPQSRGGWVAAYPYRARRRGVGPYGHRWTVRHRHTVIATITGPASTVVAYLEALQSLDAVHRMTRALMHLSAAGLYAKAAAIGGGP